jgi:hypothetical protein
MKSRIRTISNKLPEPLKGNEEENSELWQRIRSYLPDRVVDSLHVDGCLIEGAWSSSLEARIELHLDMIRNAVEREISINYDKILMEDLRGL